jgi:energy-coupling factor transporter ATP-binding protein EcfA2
MAELSGRPLLDNPRDETLFVGRDRLIGQALRAVRQGVNVLLVGPRGSGKTSTLHRLAHRLRERQRPAALVDGRAATNPGELLQVIRWRLGGARYAAPLAAEGETEMLLMLIHSIEEQTRGSKGDGPVVLLDEAPDAEAAHRLFGRLRDEIWRLPLAWVVAADATDRAAHLKPPADAFFSRVLCLDPLEPEACRRLLEARAPELGAPAIQLLAERAGGNPRALVQMAQEVLLGERTAEEVASGEERMAAIVEELGEAARRLFGELSANGGLSVSDPALLRRLGWSRPRAQQVIGRLEAAGLVEAAVEPAARGRPRKLYRLRDGGAAAGVS